MTFVFSANVDLIYCSCKGWFVDPLTSVENIFSQTEYVTSIWYWMS